MNSTSVHASIVRFLIHLALGTTHTAAVILRSLDAFDIPDQTKRVLKGVLLTCQGRDADVFAKRGEQGSSDAANDLVVANNEAVALLDTGALGQVSILAWTGRGNLTANWATRTGSRKITTRDGISQTG